MLDQLLSSRVLTISRSPDFDHFRSIERLGDARSIPLHWRNFAAGFAAVTLKSCSVYLQRTFPRILQTRYVATGAIVAFAMDDAVSVIIDGIEVRQPSVLLVRGEVPCEIVEPQALVGAVPVRFLDRARSGAIKHHGDALELFRARDFIQLAQLDFEDVLVEENQCVKRLILRAGRTVTERGEERFDFRLTQVAHVFFTVKLPESNQPGVVSFEGVFLEMTKLTFSLQQCRHTASRV